jgi:hypothetical protein
MFDETPDYSLNGDTFFNIDCIYQEDILLHGYQHLGVIKAPLNTDNVNGRD